MMKYLSFLIVFVFSLTQPVLAQLNLVGDEVETLIDNPPNSSRLAELVSKAFTDTAAQITATSPAWSGSGLLNGEFDGYIDHYSLNRERASYVFSETYADINLHIITRIPQVENYTRFDQLRNQRIGVEKRFASSDTLRSERSVKWARRNSFVENIQQLEERRVDYILADKVMIQEFNKLLVEIDKPPLFISENPVLTVGVKLAIHTRVNESNQLLSEFNQGIESLRSSGQYEKIMQPEKDNSSMLNASLYSEVLRKW